jgi:hypothetical protein
MKSLSEAKHNRVKRDIITSIPNSSPAEKSYGRATSQISYLQMLINSNTETLKFKFAFSFPADTLSILYKGDEK